jgi:hypothetical protein
MFSLPQPLENEIVDGLPVVRLSEDAEILNSLLTMLYPVPSVVPASYDKALELLAAAQKYDMTGVQSSIRTEIKSWGLIVLTGPVAYRAYAISSSANLIPEMEISARLTLNHPMTFETIADALPLFKGSALSDLVRFRKRCCNNLLSFFEGFVDGSNSLSKIWFSCRLPVTKHTSSFDKATLAVWLRDLILQHTESLEETYTNTLLEPSSLHKEIIMALLTHLSKTHCFSCPTVYATEGEAFSDQLYCRVRKVRDEEPFRLDAGANTSGDLEDANA